MDSFDGKNYRAFGEDTEASRNNAEQMVCVVNNAVVLYLENYFKGEKRTINKGEPNEQTEFDLVELLRDPVRVCMAVQDSLRLFQMEEACSPALKNDCSIVAGNVSFKRYDTEGSPCFAITYKEVEGGAEFGRQVSRAFTTGLPEFHCWIAIRGVGIIDVMAQFIPKASGMLWGHALPVFVAEDLIEVAAAKVSTYTPSQQATLLANTVANVIKLELQKKRNQRAQ